MVRAGGIEVTASYVRSAAERFLPVIIAAAPTTALRIRKLRRSTPGGGSCEVTSFVLPSGSLRSVSSVGLGTVLSKLFSLFDMVISFV
jgi:hypothetical protein